jgi:hypothetical protein
MGTRSNTIFIDGQNRILNMYRQFDGYPQGHGLELALCLAGFTIVNGYGEANQTTANGMGCLAAFVVSRFKTNTGGIYLAPMNDFDNDFTYTVKQTKKGLKVTVKEWGTVVFAGSLDKFIVFCKEEQV